MTFFNHLICRFYFLLNSRFFLLLFFIFLKKRRYQSYFSRIVIIFSFIFSVSSSRLADYCRVSSLNILLVTHKLLIKKQNISMVDNILFFCMIIQQLHVTSQNYGRGNLVYLLKKNILLFIVVG